MDKFVTRQFSGQEVGEAIHTMQQVLQDSDPMLVLSACLALAVLISYPEATSEQLDRGVTGASEWIALYADSLDPDPEEKVN